MTVQPLLRPEEGGDPDPVEEHPWREQQAPGVELLESRGVEQGSSKKSLRKHTEVRRGGCKVALERQRTQRHLLDGAAAIRRTTLGYRRLDGTRPHSRRLSAV